MKSHLTPEFAKDFPDAIKGAATGVSTIRGIGGSAGIDAATLPEITLRIGGSDAVLNPAEVLLKNPEGRADPFHVWAGMDLFEHATQVMIDLRSMRFTVE
jgi:hypothetical protein